MLVSQSELPQEKVKTSATFNNDRLFQVSFLFFAILSIAMDASVNKDIEHVRNYTIRASVFQNSSLLHNVTANQHRYKAWNYTDLAHNLQDEAADLYQKAEDEHKNATEFDDKMKNSLAMANQDHTDYNELLRIANEDRKHAQELIENGQSLENQAEDLMKQFEARQKNLFFCNWKMIGHICDAIGGAALIGKAAQLNGLGAQNIAQGIAEQANSDHEFEQAKEALKEEHDNSDLVTKYAEMESELESRADQDKLKADEELIGANQLFEQVDNETRQANQDEAYAREAMLKRDEAIQNGKKWEFRVKMHALGATAAGMLAVLLFCALCVQCNIAHVVLRHQRLRNKLPASMRQNFATYSTCHFLTFLLVAGLMQNSLVNIYDYETRARGEIIFSFSTCAAAIETILFSFLSFAYNAIGFLETESISDYWDCSYNERVVVLVSIFIIQVIILICTFATQILILLIVCGNTSLLFNIFRFMSHWSSLAMISLVLVALSRIWSPLEFRDTQESGIPETESEYLVGFDQNEHDRKYDSVNFSIERSESSGILLPGNRHDDESTSWDGCSSMTFTSLQSALSSSKNEFMWLKGEIYIFGLCLLLLVLSSVVAVILNCFPLVGVYGKWTLSSCFVVVLAFQIHRRCN